MHNRLIPIAVAIVAVLFGQTARAQPTNLVSDPMFEKLDDHHSLVAYQIAGDLEWGNLGDARRDSTTMGVTLQSAKDINHDGSFAGSISQTVAVDPADGRWLRFEIHGLPQDGFAVENDDLYMKAEFFGGGKSLDGKLEKIYPALRQARKDLSVNGDRHIGGAAVWRNYQLDFYLPFPQIDHVKLTVGFDYGVGRNPANAGFLISSFSLSHLLLAAPSTTRPVEMAKPPGTLLPLGGRWYYLAKNGQTQPPEEFDASNADRLLYHDATWSAPFAGNMSAWLKAGDLDLFGNLVSADQFIEDNVTVRFDDDSLIIHTHNLPNHPTGRFPEVGFGNPNHIQEKDRTYFIPLNPKVNARHIFTTTDNSNHALNMGPIGIALNGVVFFNPFDANSQDASNMMDRCCGHPAPDGTYHYHKYPICVNSPWADQGTEHSPLIGFAFDGFPIYGPYESKDVMAKDLVGPDALNSFNLHWDKDRGWHYHVTPGKFPYIIGGYWGTVDSRDVRMGRPMGGPGGGPPPGRGPNGPMDLPDGG